VAVIEPIYFIHMRFLLTIFTTFFFMALASAEEAFDNWFFSFFKGETEMYGKYFSAEGDLIEEGSGVMKSEIDTEKMIEKSETNLTFKISGDTVKSTSVLKSLGEGKFSGTAEDSKGKKYTMELEVLPDNKYRTIAQCEGQNIEIEGELKDDGLVHSKETISVDGKPAFTSEIVYAKKEVTEQK